MRRLRAWIIRVSGVLHRTRQEREFGEELESNLELQIEERVRAGMPPAEGRRAALVALGSREAVKEAWRDRHSIPFIETTIRDARYALRMLARNRGWTLVAVASLALGIGINAMLFSTIHKVVFARLALPDAGELVALRWAGPNDMRAGMRSYGITPADPEAGPAGSEFPFAAFEAIRSEQDSLVDLFAFAPVDSLNIVAGSGAELTRGQYVSGSSYSALRIPAFRGRVIGIADDSPSADPVAVLSYEYWYRRFDADGSVIGRAILINGLSFTIAGVTPPGLGDPLGTGRMLPPISLPLSVEARLPKANQTNMGRPAVWWLMVMGRLRPGVAPQQVQAALEPLFQRAVRDDWELSRSGVDVVPSAGGQPRVGGREGAQLAPPSAPSPPGAGGTQVPGLRVIEGAHGVYGIPREASIVFMIVAAVFAIVLLVVCMNLASLLLSRMTARRREIAVRQAIGAARGRLVRQLLTENMVLALAGGGLSLLVSYWCVLLVPALITGDPAAAAEGRALAPHAGTVLGFTGLLAVLTAFLFGLFPALWTSRDEYAWTDGGKGATNTAPRSRPARTLVVSQVAMSLFLLIVAGLFLRTLANLRSVAVGFNPDSVLVFQINPALAGYDASRTAALYERSLEAFRAIPGVRSASLSGFEPLGGLSRRTDIYFRGRDLEAADVATLNVHHDFFETLEIPLRLGRGFTAHDGPDAPRVAVVNEAFARAFLPDEHPLGVRFGFETEDAGGIEIVGVVADARFSSLREPAPPVFYTPHVQPGPGSSFRTFEVRTATDPEAMAGAIRDAIRSVDAGLPLVRLSTYRDRMEVNLARERIVALVASVFGGMTLVLSMIGLFGLMSYSVAQRTREIGVRMALGAGRGRVLRAVFRESLSLVGFGLALGLGAALAATPLIQSLLYGLAPHDPSTLTAAVVLILTVAALASYLPARRASKVDPMVALRHE